MTFKKELMLLGAAAATSTVAYFIHLENKKNAPKGAEEVLSLSPDTWVGSQELAKKIQQEKNSSSKIENNQNKESAQRE